GDGNAGSSQVSPVQRSRRLIVIAVVGALLGCADPHSELQPVPMPDASSFEASVRNAVTTARATFDKIAAQKPDDAQLAAAYAYLAMTYHTQDLVAPAEAAYANAHLLAPRDKRWPYL